MATTLIVGASRGIGREMARQYAADGARVIATHRKAEDGEALRAMGAKAVELDVLDPDAIASFGWQLEGEAIDIAVIAAGVYGPKTGGIGPPAREDFDAVMHTNVLAPMLLIPLVAQSLQAARGKLVVLSSRMGSIGTMSSTSAWLYRASKAGLNCVLKAASIELGAREVVCMALHPGWVRTEMGGSGANLDVRDSVTAMRRVIAAANRSHNGRFLNYNGEQLEW